MRSDRSDIEIGWILYPFKGYAFGKQRMKTIESKLLFSLVNILGLTLDHDNREPLQWTWIA